MDISQIETRIKQLIDKCKRLDEENLQLRGQFSGLKQQCETLQGKHNVAVDAIENMVERLQKIEG